jgi:hypothetical protein
MAEGGVGIEGADGQSGHARDVDREGARSDVSGSGLWGPSNAAVTAGPLWRWDSRRNATRTGPDGSAHRSRECNVCESTHS